MKKKYNVGFELLYLFESLYSTCTSISTTYWGFVILNTIKKKKSLGSGEIFLKMYCEKA